MIVVTLQQMMRIVGSVAGVDGGVDGEGGGGASIIVRHCEMFRWGQTTLMPAEWGW